mgnify:CR=1 FL=1
MLYEVPYTSREETSFYIRTDVRGNAGFNTTMVMRRLQLEMEQRGFTFINNVRFYRSVDGETQPTNTPVVRTFNRVRLGRRGDIDEDSDERPSAVVMTDQQIAQHDNALSTSLLDNASWMATPEHVHRIEFTYSGYNRVVSFWSTIPNPSHTLRAMARLHAIENGLSSAAQTIADQSARLITRESVDPSDDDYPFPWGSPSDYDNSDAEQADGGGAENVTPPSFDDFIGEINNAETRRRIANQAAEASRARQDNPEPFVMPTTPAGLVEAARIFSAAAAEFTEQEVRAAIQSIVEENFLGEIDAPSTRRSMELRAESMYNTYLSGEGDSAELMRAGMRNRIYQRRQAAVNAAAQLPARIAARAQLTLDELRSSSNASFWSSPRRNMNVLPAIQSGIDLAAVEARLAANFAAQQAASEQGPELSPPPTSAETLSRAMEQIDAAIGRSHEAGEQERLRRQRGTIWMDTEARLEPQNTRRTIEFIDNDGNTHQRVIRNDAGIWVDDAQVFDPREQRQDLSPEFRLPIQNSESPEQQPPLKRETQLMVVESRAVHVREFRFNPNNFDGGQRVHIEFDVFPGDGMSAILDDLMRHHTLFLGRREEVEVGGPLPEPQRTTPLIEM